MKGTITLAILYMALVVFYIPLLFGIGELIPHKPGEPDFHPLYIQGGVAIALGSLLALLQLWEKIQPGCLYWFSSTILLVVDLFFSLLLVLMYADDSSNPNWLFRGL